MFKKFIQSKLEKSVKKYFIKHPEVRLVVVAGSVGKTSTKMAIGTVLSQALRVRLHEGNHNSELSAPLAILGIEYPENIRSLGQWRLVFKAIKQRIKQPADVDVIIQELGTDAPGQIPHFGTYLSPDIAVITSVAPEHMEFFKTIEAVAAEELTAANFSKSVLINRDDVAGMFANNITNPNLNTYGTTDMAEYRFEADEYMQIEGTPGAFIAPEWTSGLAATLHVLGEHSTRAAVAAGAVGVKFGLTPEAIATGLAMIRPVSGRMNPLRGVQDTLIIDDSYNSSPLAAASALRTLYQLNVPQKIAILGSMNELGNISPAAHAEVGKLCDPTQLSHLITVGEDAAKYLAPAAKTAGCQVVSVRNAIEAGAYANQLLEPGAALLFKGSQGGIFLEEAVKIVLLSTSDEEKLVRQSPDWLKKKQDLFEGQTFSPMA
ncbi:hypothetical protein KI440_01435 [Candidatus Saccharibacteria bacterium TM7i]|nr:hypothetical protein KI440_01435 [Candidatus Saccharibacteria bacterium TM7i]